MDGRDELINTLASLTLFADLSRPQLEAVAHTFEDEYFAEGQRILRQGFSGSNLYIVLSGEAAVYVNGTQRATLARGDFFGEISVLLGEPPAADVVAVHPLRCLVLPAVDVEAFLQTYPRVTYRMLQAEARRVRTANLWR
ncbi:MAG: cyclic nucleotide-binding domain-containing protein [Armatimonadetes bacterium]|nr:cyclic nucleotide-binding domain-containing protein [Armatimonadota bacterium]MBI2246780.1 cyclic nucleotide-binding domain-containing protein [Armatimonadota bacterium]MBI2972732.1 cyclic nucleotide-binding domain-containing protein [Armatimonadota bacterium]